MPGRAERIRRTRRLGVLVLVVGAAVALVLVLGPGLRHLPQPPAPVPSGATPTATRAPTGTGLPSPDPSVPPAEEVGVSDCGGTPPAVRPAQVVVVCGSLRPVVVSEVTWSSWGQLAATGTAVVTTNDCEPTCADGFERESSATVVLDRVVTTRGGTQFSRATLVWAPNPPEGFRDPFQSGLPVFRG